MSTLPQDPSVAPVPPVPAAPHPIRRAALLRRLGPGLITGAADDDPSGIATYSQAGAQFGVNLLWTVVFTLPLMVVIQMISARIGRVTGHGLATNMGRIFPGWMVTLLICGLFVANTVNIGADLAATGAAAELVLGWGQQTFTIAFAAISLLLQIFVPYHRYVRYLKWLTLVLFAYVGVVFTVEIDWVEVALSTFTPDIALTSNSFTMVVAVFGTTISPYLFFWQSSEEVEDEEADGSGALLEHPADAPAELRRIEWDTLLGMAFSNVIAFCIMLTAAVTLNRTGQVDIRSAADAAAALRPLAGEFAFVLFALGIVGTGLLAIPVLAGSAAYAVGESRGWRVGLERKPWEAIGFYTVIALAVVLGVALSYSRIDPIQALIWAAVLNGVISTPIMAATMVIASRKDEMGQFAIPPAQRILGWAITAVMLAASIGMFVLG